jgi:hypothetical protein
VVADPNPAGWTDWLQTVLGGTIGGIVGGGAALLAARQSHRGQLARDDLADQRNLRDQRRDRLRADYEAVLRAGWALRDYPQENVYVLTGEEPSERGADVVKGLLDALESLRQARTKLFLEADAAPVRDSAEALARAFLTLEGSRADNQEQLGTVSIQTLAQQAQQLNQAYEQLEEVTKERYQALDQPVGLRISEPAARSWTHWWPRLPRLFQRRRGSHSAER